MARAREVWEDTPLYNGPLQRGTEAAGSSDEDLWAFRRLTGSDKPADLDETTYERYQNLAVWLYYQNPPARRLCDVVTDMVLGGGVNIETDKQMLSDVNAGKVKELIDRFRLNPDNSLDTRLHSMFTILSAVNGELFLPVFITPANGDVIIGHLENYYVTRVQFDPKNRMKALGVVQRTDEVGKDPYWWNVVNAEQGAKEVMFPVHPDLDIRDKAERAPAGYRYAGELLYFRANVLGTGRGRSALEPALDWLHAYDNFLFGDLRNANLQSAFVWDVTINGATKPELVAKAEEIRKMPPRHGEVNVHNENEIWAAISPNLNAATHTELGVQVKKIIGMAMGLPSHLVGAEGDTNRTTSVSSDIPFLRRMEQRQRLLDYMISTLIDYQLDQKRHVNILKGERPYPYRTILPRLTAVEVVGQAEALYNITQSMLDAGQNRILPLSEQRRILYGYGLGEPDVPDGLDDQVEKEIREGHLPDKVQAEKDAAQAKAAGPNNGTDSGAKRGLRAKSITGR
jgi:hypothetical protein